MKPSDLILISRSRWAQACSEDGVAPSVIQKMRAQSQALGVTSELRCTRSGSLSLVAWGGKVLLISLTTHLPAHSYSPQLSVPKGVSQP